MKEFVISAEAFCDMDPAYMQQQHVNLMGAVYALSDDEYQENTPNCLDPKTFYDRLRKGEMPRTSQVSVEQARASFEEIVRSGKDVLHISFSSALSGTCQSCTIAANDVMERYPDSKVLVVDSLSASMGHGLLVEYALRLKAAGKTIEETAALVTQNRLKFCHYFTVDDLNHLHRGGRVSKVSAVVGGMLGIKPILNVNEEGKLIPFAKVRGRKQSLLALVENMKKKYHNDLDLPVFISHGDAPEDANFVADRIREHFGIQDIRIGTIGPVIGAHAGPGTVALFFIGKDRSI